MKKDIGSIMALYPSPLTVVGTVVDGKVNWLTIAHVGILDMDTFSISVGKFHKLSNKGLTANQTVSVNLITKDLLQAADYCGTHQGEKVDKSHVFPYHFDDVPGAPIIDTAPLTMTCRIVGNFAYGLCNNYILKPVHTYVDAKFLNVKGKIDYALMKPILFDKWSSHYLSTGPVVADCYTYGRKFNEAKVAK